jgi:hypothetical protein
MPHVAQVHARIAAVEARCEPHARSLLDALRIDSLYPEVIRALGKTTGKVTYRDVEDAVIRMQLRTRGTKSKRSPDWLGEWKPTIERVRAEH